jgi:Flp pilus assembly protein TadB
MPRAGSSAGRSHNGVALAAKKKTQEQVVRIAPLGELRAYTISEHELEKLEQGAPVSDLLTIGLCLLSAALTVLVTVLSTSLTAQTFTLFFCTLLITGLGGAICTFLGWRLRTNTKELVRQIRDRMPDAPTVQQVTIEPVTNGPLVETSSEPTSPAQAPPGLPTPPAGQAGTPTP